MAMWVYVSRPVDRVLGRVLRTLNVNPRGDDQGMCRRLPDISWNCRVLPGFRCIVALFAGTPIAIFAFRFISFHFIAALQTLHATIATMQRNDFPRTSTLPLCQRGDTVGKVLFGNFSITLDF